MVSFKHYLIDRTYVRFNKERKYIVFFFLDKRTRGWFLLDSIWILVFIEVLYLSFVKYIGPKLMANRKPFNIDKLLIIYNICQIFANAYIFYLVNDYR